MTQKINLLPSQCYFRGVKFDGSELQSGKKKLLSCKRCSSLVPEWISRSLVIKQESETDVSETSV
jgi:hypothetical protein